MRTRRARPASYETSRDPEFWRLCRRLPPQVRRVADKNFVLLKADPSHPSLQFKQIGRLRSARVGLRHRALAVESGEGLVWFWIGSHAEYDRIISEA